MRFSAPLTAAHPPVPITATPASASRTSRAPLSPVWLSYVVRVVLLARDFFA